MARKTAKQLQEEERKKKKHANYLKKKEQDARTTTTTTEGDQRSPPMDEAPSDAQETTQVQQVSPPRLIDPAQVHRIITFCQLTEEDMYSLQHNEMASFMNKKLIAYAGFLALNHAKRVTIVSQEYFEKVNHPRKGVYHHPPMHFSVGANEDPDIVIMPFAQMFKPTQLRSSENQRMVRVPPPIQHHFIGVYQKDGTLIIYNTLSDRFQYNFLYDGVVPDDISGGMTLILRDVYKDPKLRPTIKKAAENYTHLGLDLANAHLHATLLIETILTKKPFQRFIYPPPSMRLHRPRFYENLKGLFKEPPMKYEPIPRNRHIYTTHAMPDSPPRPSAASPSAQPLQHSQSPVPHRLRALPAPTNVALTGFNVLQQTFRRAELAEMVAQPMTLLPDEMFNALTFYAGYLNPRRVLTIGTQYAANAWTNMTLEEMNEVAGEALYHGDRRNFELIYIAVHLPNHYGAAIYDRATNVIEYFDSLRNSTLPAAIRRRLQDVVLELLPENARPEVRQVQPEELRHNLQRDGHRCGYYAGGLFIRHATFAGNTYIENLQTRDHAQAYQNYLNDIFEGLLQEVYQPFHPFVGQPPRCLLRPPPAPASTAEESQSDISQVPTPAPLSRRSSISSTATNITNTTAISTRSGRISKLPKRVDDGPRVTLNADKQQARRDKEKGRRSLGTSRANASPSTNQRNEDRRRQYDTNRRSIETPKSKKVCAKRHPGWGCAAKDIFHPIKYYDSGDIGITQTQIIGGYKDPAQQGKTCEHCGAGLLRKETSNNCCANGQVRVEPFKEEPEELLRLWDPDNMMPGSLQLKNKAASYNNAMAFASISSSSRDAPGRGPPVHLLNGQFSHQIGDLAPGQGQTHRWDQLYILDSDAATDQRKTLYSTLNRDMLARLDRLIRYNNPLAADLKPAYERWRRACEAAEANGQELPRFRMCILDLRSEQIRELNPTLHPHRLNPANDEEACGIWVEGVDGQVPDQMGIYLYAQGTRPHKIGLWNMNRDWLCYPLIFPCGDQTYGYRIPLYNPVTGIPLAPSTTDEPMPLDVTEEPEDQANAEIEDMDDIPAGDEANAQADDDDEENDANATITIRCPGAQDPAQPRDAPFRRSSAKYQSRRQYYRHLYAIRGDTWKYHRLWSKRSLASKFVIDQTWRVLQTELEALKKIQGDNRWQSALSGDLRANVENHRPPGTRLGKMFIAPHTFNLSRSCLRRRVHLSCTIRRHIQPTARFFVTMTVNPLCPEIKRNLIPDGQKPLDRPDLLCRYAFDKFDELHNTLEGENGVFGQCLSFAESTENQKRGPHHVHWLGMYRPEQDPDTTDYIDQYISAEIPDLPDEATERDEPEKAEQMRRLRHLVQTLMIHECKESSVCRLNGKCTKGFPKPFKAETHVPFDGRPTEYMRRDPAHGGNSFLKRNADGSIRLITNQDVVPYSPYLLLKFGSHICVEYVSGNSIDRYIFKYQFKGPEHAAVWTYRDRNQDPRRRPPQAATIVEDPPAAIDEPEDVPMPAGDEDHDPRPAEDTAAPIVDYDETNMIKEMRYMSHIEAVGVMNSMKSARFSHPIMDMAVHLPGQNPIIFHAGDEIQVGRQIIAGGRITQLMAYFHLCNNTDTSEHASQFTFPEIPTYYRWDKNKKEWIRRAYKTTMITSIYTVYASKPELFAFRLLMHHLKGVRSYEDARTLNRPQDTDHKPDEPSSLCQTFVEAARARGLIEDDKEWERTLDEASGQMNNRLFTLFFARLLIYCQPADPRSLFNAFFKYMLNAARDHRNESVAAYEARVQDLLRRLARIFRSYNRTNADFSLPMPDNFSFDQEEEINRAFFPQNYDDYAGNPPVPADEQMAAAEAIVETMNPGQKQVVQKVRQAVEKIQAQGPGEQDEQIQRLFYLGGSGGTGKTYTYNTLLSLFRAHGIKILACASTGIAATLLDGATTAHKLFGIPIKNFDANTPSAISHDDDRGRILKQAQVIIIEECSMVHEHVLICIDRLLKYLTGSTLEFGGKVVIIGGDVKQLMPIVPGGTIEEQAQVSFFNTKWYNEQCEHLTLTQNMRLAEGQQQYGTWLESVGKGLTIDMNTMLPGTHTGKMNLLQGMQVDSEDQMIARIFDGKQSRKIPAFALDEPFSARETRPPMASIESSSCATPSIMRSGPTIPPTLPLRTIL